MRKPIVGKKKENFREKKNRQKTEWLKIRNMTEAKNTETEKEFRKNNRKKKSFTRSMKQ